MGSDVENGTDIPFDDRPAGGTGTRGAADGGTQVPRARAAAGDGSDTPGEPGPAAAAESPVPPRTEDRDRRRSGSTGPTGMREDLGTLAEEATKLWSALEARFIAPAARAYPDVTRHLGLAGRELLNAYRSAVGGQEQAWRDAGSGPRHEKITVERVDPSDPAGPEDRQKNRD